jgi:2-amino-4-hydroxy-6-hydroxymethyldihydropteridine diphosphokinase
MTDAKTAARITAFVGIGSNLGDSLANVRNAILQIGLLPQTSVSAQSSLFRTAPIDADGDDYINAVIRIDTGLTAGQLLHELQALETAVGRERPYPNAPRVLDLDILLYGRQKIASAGLTVPHPRLTQRAFALIPLLQIDPFVEIPGYGPAHRFAADVAQQVIRKI